MLFSFLLPAFVHLGQAIRSTLDIYKIMNSFFFFLSKELKDEIQKSESKCVSLYSTTYALCFIYPKTF
jgi:hypothetical protein